MSPLETVQDLLDLEEDLVSTVDLQKAVNRAKTLVSLYPLTPHKGVYGGSVEYRVFTSDLSDWESDVVFHDGNYELIVPAESDETIGKWTFSTEPTLPVMISGTTVDVYLACAIVLESLASNTGEHLSSFSGQNGAFSLAGKSHNYRELARTYRSQQRLGSFVITRVDS